MASQLTQNINNGEYAECDIDEYLGWVRLPRVAGDFPLLSIAAMVLVMAKKRESIQTAILIGGALVGLLVTLVVVAIFGIELQSNIGLKREWDNRNLVLIGGALAGAALGGWVYSEVTEDEES